MKTKILISCAYCSCLFEDTDDTGICEDCQPKYFIDMAIDAIYQGVVDLENVRKVENRYMLERNEQLRELSKRLDQLQQVE